MRIKTKRNVATSAIAEDYQVTTPTDGNIEARYLANGSHEVSCLEDAADERLVKYLIFYPSELETNQRQYPVIIYSNGSGVTGSKCIPLFRHWASWGFIVAANEESSSWSGQCAVQTLAYLLDQNSIKGSLFHEKVDIGNVGITGHSQGGVSVFNALTKYGRSPAFKTGVPVSPTHDEFAKNMRCGYDLTKINASILMLAGTKGDLEMKTVMPSGAMERMYDKLGVPKAMARKKDCTHSDTDTAMDGYVTAWFTWQLQGDEEAAKAFTGESPELMTNPLYRDQQIDIESVTHHTITLSTL